MWWGRVCRTAIAVCILLRSKYNTQRNKRHGRTQPKRTLDFPRKSAEFFSVNSEFQKHSRQRHSWKEHCTREQVVNIQHVQVHRSVACTGNSYTYRYSTSSAEVGRTRSKSSTLPKTSPCEAVAGNPQSERRCRPLKYSPIVANNASWLAFVRHNSPVLTVEATCAASSHSWKLTCGNCECECECEHACEYEGCDVLRCRLV